MMEKYKCLFDVIDNLTDEKKSNKYYNKLMDYTEKIPIIGFNSGRYDINLNITEFIGELVKRNGNDIFSIKNGNTFKMLKSGNCMFRYLSIFTPFL